MTRAESKEVRSGRCKSETGQIRQVAEARIGAYNRRGDASETRSGDAMSRLAAPRGGWEGIEGIILDAVGTLIEPSPPVAQVYAAAARRQGLEIDPAEVKRRFHRFFRVDEVDEQLGPLATDEATEFRRWRRIVGNVLPELADTERAFGELWEHFGTASAWRTFDDVGSAIHAIRTAGFRLVIASNFDGRLRQVIRGLPELAEIPIDPVISSEVGFRKPHPSFYLAACERLGLSANQTLCVGDDLENDVLGPERAGLRGLLLDRDGRGPEDIASLPDMNALVTALLNLEKQGGLCR
jgi:putative hydrolase of the HAD superfamily